MAPPLSSHPHTEENRELCREMHIYFIYFKDLLMLRPKKIITTLRFDPEQRALTQEFIFLKSHLSLFEIWQAVQESSVLLLPFYFCLWVYVLWVLSNTGAMQASHFCLCLEQNPAPVWFCWEFCSSSKLLWLSTWCANHPMPAKAFVTKFTLIFRRFFFSD